MNEQEIREQICDVCHKMWQQGWVAANDGNVSVKIGEDLYLATPTGISKSFITPEKLIKINGKGEVLEALEGYRPSSEIKMHLRCYQEREDVGAVVHAHPATATGFACAHVPMDDYAMIESVIAIGSVPIAPYGTPSTDEVPEGIAPFLKEHDVILLENHGALPGFQHRRDAGLGQKEGPGQIDLDDVLPFFHGHIQNGAGGACDARAVHDGIDPPVFPGFRNQIKA